MKSRKLIDNSKSKIDEGKFWSSFIEEKLVSNFIEKSLNESNVYKLF